MAKVESRIEKQAAGATTQADLKGKLVEFMWWLKKQGRADKTIKNYATMLKGLVKAGCRLDEPETVKDILARLEKSNAWKNLAVAAYTAYLKMQGGRWEAPNYRVTRKMPFIPTEAEIDALIASCGRKTACFLQLLKETAMRAGEANNLRWTDVDLERRTIALNYPEKRGKARIFRISEKLAEMLGYLPKNDEQVFNSTLGGRRSTFTQSRKRTAAKLGNPRLIRICFHTLRHWKATIEYHRTKDLLYVKQLLGHRTVETTMLYIQLEKALYNETSDTFHSATAGTIVEAQKLIEAGFDYVCAHGQVMLFKKRK